MKKVFLGILGGVTILCVVFGTLWHFGAFSDGKAKFNMNFPFFGDKGVAGDFSDTQLLPQTMTELYIDTSVANLTVQVGSVNSVEMKWTHDYLEPTVSIEGSVVHIEQQRKRINASGNSKCSITVTVPPQLSVVKIETDVGNVESENVGASNAKFESDVGNVRIEGGTFTALTAKSDTGNIRVENALFDTCTADSDVGNVRIELPSDVNGQDYSVSLKTDVGNVHAFGQSYKQTFTQSVPGGKFINAQSDVGNVNVE